MKQEDTKKIILKMALELFSERGYDSVSVGEIAQKVGIKAPSLYNHYKSKEEIFQAIVSDTAERYENGTDKIDIHVANVSRDIPSFKKIASESLAEKVKQLFLYSLHDETVSRFRKMMTIEQFRSEKLAKLYSERYVDRMIAYHADIFRSLIAAGEIVNEDPITLATSYVSPIITLLGVCDRQPEREAECLDKLEKHVKLFFDTYNVAAKKNKK